MDIKEYKEFVKNLDEEVIDVIGDDYTSCWMFAYYTHIKYNLPTLNHEPLYETNQEDEFNLNQNGIYSYFMCHNSEMHHFVLFVNNNDLIMRATYGGQKNIIEIKYDKTIFIRKFKDLMINNNIKNYCELFGIKKVSFNKLDMSDFTLSYTFREQITP